VAASGLVVTTTSGIFSFAHGAFSMMAAFTYGGARQWGVPAIWSFLIVVFLAAPLFGAVIERHHARNRGRPRW
jgi:branched-subunit amino acid ABC-type transport system permease component